jgi:lipopolysaccharide export system protein LptC
VFNPFQPRKIALAVFIVLGALAGTYLWQHRSELSTRHTSPEPILEMDKPIQNELELQASAFPPSAQTTFRKWMDYIHKIDTNATTELTYAKGIAFTLSTVGEQHWELASDAGVYEDAKQQQVLMRDVTGTLMRHESGGRQTAVLRMKAAFAHYNAEKQYVTLYGRSKVIVGKAVTSGV